MKCRRLFRYLAAVSSVAALGCGDYTGPTSPVQKDVSLAAPAGAAYSRWMLISGVWVCTECADPAQSLEGGGGLYIIADSASSVSLVH
jgi:hypothetical protein